MAVDWTTDHLNGTNERQTLQIVSDADPVIDADVYGAVHISAQAAAITGVTMTGTPDDLQEFIFRIKDNGVARAITWGAQFLPMGVALPTTTTAGKNGTYRFLYDANSSIWGLVSAVTEA